MSSPRYSLLIANRNTGAVRRFTVVRRTALLGALLLWVVPTLVGLGARWAAKTEIETLRITNDGLRIENESFRTATGQLAMQISTLQTALTQIGEQAQLDPATRAAIDKLPALVKSRAMGGGPVTALTTPSTKIAGAATTATTFDILRDLLGVLDERLKSVRSGLEQRQALAAATPSIWPLSGWLSSSYGVRPDPFTGESDFHAGLDISADRGTPVHATADGTVESVGYNGNYGNSIVVSHGFGIATRFGHLSTFAVRVGQKITRNQVVGFVGSTGRTTGPHLHYEILFNGQPINPLRFLTRP